MSHVVTSPAPPFSIAGNALQVHQIPVWQDNLVWLIADPKTKAAAAVDGPAAAPVLEYCRTHGLQLTTILNTHTHGDHIGINRDLQASGALSSLRVVGPAKVRSNVPGLTEAVKHEDRIEFGGVSATIWLTEGHLDGHISYVFDDAVFCGDTLFGAGCGYLFDGPPRKMHESLTLLGTLPPATRVCCAHEYTQDNLRFAWSVEPDNDELAERIRSAWSERGAGRSTIPSTIGLELATNPFLRTRSETIRRRVHEALPRAPLDSDAEVFAAIRALKDKKDYRRISDADLPLT